MTNPVMIDEDTRVALCMLHQTLNVCCLLEFSRLKEAFTREFGDRVIEQLPFMKDMVERILKELPDMGEDQRRKDRVRQDVFTIAYACGAVSHFLNAHRKET